MDKTNPSPQPEGSAPNNLLTTSDTHTAENDREEILGADQETFEFEFDDLDEFNETKDSIATLAYFCQQMNDPQTGTYTHEPAPRPSLAKFTQFMDLPPELRIKVWTEVCNQPRILDAFGVITAEDESHHEMLRSIRALEYDEESESDSDDDEPVKIGVQSVCGRRAPAVLHVNKESRKIGLEHYQLSFGHSTSTEINGTTFSFERPPKVYINWKSDILCPITDPWNDQCERMFGFDIRHPMMSQIRHLAINFLDAIRWARHDDGEGNFTEMSLKTLTIFYEVGVHHKHVTDGTLAPRYWMSLQGIGHYNNISLTSINRYVQLVSDPSELDDLEAIFVKSLYAKYGILEGLEAHKTIIESLALDKAMKPADDPWTPPEVKFMILKVFNDGDSRPWSCGNNCSPMC